MKINFGIIGCGHIAHRHAEHIIENTESGLISAFDIKQDKLDAFCNEYEILKSNSCEELLSNSDIDIITVCTPNGIHHDGVIASLNAGKHVLVEKPMALTRQQCENMINAAEQNKKELFIVKQNRYNPPVQKLKQLVEQKKLGKIYFVQVNCFWNRNDKYYLDSDWKGTKHLDGGTLYTQFSHFVDILYYLFGDIENIKGIIKNVSHQNLIEFEDTGSYTFNLMNGALGNFNYTTSSYTQNMEGSITVFAENATIKIGGRYLNTIEYQRTRDFDIKDVEQARPANNYGYYEGSMSNHDKVIDNVIDTLNGKAKIMTNAQEGMKVVDIIERMYNSVI